MIAIEEPTATTLFRADVIKLLEQREKEVANGLGVTCLKGCVKVFPELGAISKESSSSI